MSRAIKNSMNARGLGFEDFSWLSASARATRPASRSAFATRWALRMADFGVARTHSQLARGLVAVHCARQSASFDEFAVAKRERADEAYRLFTFAQEIIEKFESFCSLLYGQHVGELPDGVFSRCLHEGFDIGSW